MEKERYAYCSEKMAVYRKNFYDCYNETIKPYAIYLTKDGKEVKTTLVLDNECHRTNWDDIVYCGKVVKFVRNE